MIDQRDAHRGAVGQRDVLGRDAAEIARRGLTGADLQAAVVLFQTDDGISVQPGAMARDRIGDRSRMRAQQHRAQIDPIRRQ